MKKRSKMFFAVFISLAFVVCTSGAVTAAEVPITPVTLIHVKNNPEDNEVVEGATVTVEYLGKGPGMYSHTETTTEDNGVAVFYSRSGRSQITIKQDGEIVQEAKFYKPSIIKGVTIYLNGKNRGTLN